MDIVKLAVIKKMFGGSGGSGDGGFDVKTYFECGFTEVNLPNNITHLRDSAFFGDRVVVNVIMPKVTSIGMNAFSKCLNLVMPELPEG